MRSLDADNVGRRLLAAVAVSRRGAFDSLVRAWQFVSSARVQLIFTISWNAEGD